MTLPTTRDITLAPGTQIPSTLLNNLQDMIIGGRFGSIRKLTQALAGMGPGGGTPEGTLVTPAGDVRLAIGEEWMLPLDVHPGMRISDVFMTASGTIANDIDVQFSRNGALVGAVLNYTFLATGVDERSAIAFAGPYTVEDPSVSIGDGIYSVFFSNPGPTTVDIQTIDYLVDK